jgi:hypothetical protein
MEHNEEDRLIKELLANYKSPEDLMGENGLLKRLTKKLVEGALGAESRRPMLVAIPST